MTHKYLSNSLFVGWIELFVSFVLLMVCAIVYQLYGPAFSTIARNLLAFFGFLIAGGALGLLARNVTWRAENSHRYHSLPKWAFVPFSVLFSFLSLAVIIQLIGYFSFADLLYVLVIAFITCIGVVDVIRTYVKLRTTQ